MNILHNLHRASQIGEALFAQKLNGTEITIRQAVLLGAVKGNPGASQTVLMRETGVDRSTLADIASRMQRKGWVTRVRSKKDARAYEVKVTAAGLAALKDAQTAAKKAEAELVEQIPGVKGLAAHG